MDDSVVVTAKNPPVLSKLPHFPKFLVINQGDYPTTFWVGQSDLISCGK